MARHLRGTNGVVNSVFDGTMPQCADEDRSTSATVLALTEATNGCACRPFIRVQAGKRLAGLGGKLRGEYGDAAVETPSASP